MNLAKGIVEDGPGVGGMGAEEGNGTVDADGDSGVRGVEGACDEGAWLAVGASSLGNCQGLTSA